MPPVAPSSIWWASLIDILQMIAAGILSRVSSTDTGFMLGIDAWRVSTKEATQCRVVNTMLARQ